VASLAGLLLCAALCGEGLFWLSREPGGDVPFGALVAVAAFLTFAAAGALLSFRRPRHAIGWLLLGIGIALAAGAAMGTTARNLYPLGAPAAALWDLAGVAYTIGFGLFVILLLVFPAGSPPSRRWALLVWADIALVILACIAVVVRPGPVDSGHGPVNPLGSPAIFALTAPFAGPLGLTGLAAMLAAVAVSLVQRFLRSDGEVRQQLKWGLFGVAIAVMAIAVGAAIEFAGLGPAFANPVESTLFAVGLAATPVTIAVAVLKYCLYDLGSIVSRTLAFALLSVLVTVVYIAVVVVFTLAVGWVDRSSLIPSAVGAVVAALLVGRLWATIEGAANRLVFGQPDPPSQVVARFIDRTASALSGLEAGSPRNAPSGIGRSVRTTSKAPSIRSTSFGIFPRASGATRRLDRCQSSRRFCAT